MSKRYPGNFITGNPVALSQTSNNGVWDLKDNYAATSAGTWQESDGIYEIPNSLRFRSGTSAYLQRTPTVAGNQRTFTVSYWLKKGTVDTDRQVVSFGNTLSFLIYHGNSGTQEFTIGSQNLGVSNPWYLSSVAKFRDVGGWYHFVVAIDTTQATPSNRALAWVNGVQITAWRDNVPPSQNYDTGASSTTSHSIGRREDNGLGFLEGHLAEFNWVDGQALDPSYFGYTDSVTGIWQPKPYTGGYGTNGCYLPFKEPSATSSVVNATMVGRNFAGGTNYIRYSEDGSQTGQGYTYDRSTNIVNSTIAPNGSQTANKLTADGTASNTHRFYCGTIATPLGSTQTTSIYLKYFNCRYVVIENWNGAAYQQQTFDILNGTPMIGGVAISSVGFTSQFVGNGWYRVSLPLYAGSTNVTAPSIAVYLCDSSGNISWSGDSSSAVYWWGAQLNLGTTADPYFKTASSSTITNNWTPNGGLVTGTNIAPNSNIIHSRYLRYTDSTVPSNQTSPVNSVFNGYRDGSEGKDGVAIQYIAPTPIPYNTLEIKWGNSNNNNGAGAALYLNGTQVATVNGGQGGGKTQIYTATSGTLSYCGVGGGISGQYQSQLIYIKINGTYLTDANFDCISTDSPTNVFTTLTDIGGVVPGNYPSFNPLKLFSSNHGISEGGLVASDASTSNCMTVANMRLPATGKWYWEVTNVSGSGNNCFAGMATTESLADGITAAPGSGSYRSTGAIYDLASSAVTSGATYAEGDVIGVAVDVDAGSLQFYKNGVAQGATPSVSFTPGRILVPGIGSDNSSGTKTYYANFGQRRFQYTPPTGYKSLNTTNLQAVGTTAVGRAAITPSKWFDTIVYTGNSANTGNKISTLNFAPDFVWIKNRGAAITHSIYDTRRGAGRRLSIADNTIENNYESQMTSFNSDGFTVATTNNEVNEAGKSYVAWNWKESVASGLNIITYTGTGSTTSISHNLGVVPSMVFVKVRTGGANDWYFKHKSLASGYNLVMDSAAAQVQPTSNGYIGDLNSSSTISLVAGSSTSQNVNASGWTYVAYVFAEVPGFSKFGSYTANNAADGPFVYLGFKPKYIMVRSTSGLRDWLIWDSTRTPYNNYNTSDPHSGAQAFITGTSYTGTPGYSDAIDFLSNGFKFRNTASPNYNASSETYIYAAFAESPFALNNRAI